MGNEANGLKRRGFLLGAIAATVSGCTTLGRREFPITHLPESFGNIGSDGSAAGFRVGSNPGAGGNSGGGGQGTSGNKAEAGCPTNQANNSGSSEQQAEKFLQAARREAALTNMIIASCFFAVDIAQAVFTSLLSYSGAGGGKLAFDAKALHAALKKLNATFGNSMGIMRVTFDGKCPGDKECLKWGEDITRDLREMRDILKLGLMDMGIPGTFLSRKFDNSNSIRRGIEIIVRDLPQVVDRMLGRVKRGPGGKCRSKLRTAAEGASQEELKANTNAERAQDAINALGCYLTGLRTKLNEVNRNNVYNPHTLEKDASGNPVWKAETNITINGFEGGTAIVVPIPSAGVQLGHIPAPSCPSLPALRLPIPVMP